MGGKDCGNWFLFSCWFVVFLHLRGVLIMTEDEEFQMLEQRKKDQERREHAAQSVEAWINSRTSYGIATMSIREAYLAGYQHGWIQSDT